MHDPLKNLKDNARLRTLTQFQSFVRASTRDGKD
jgi:hypothetical protein